MCSNTEQERIQQAVLSRLFLADVTVRQDHLSPIQFACVLKESAKAKGSG